MEALINNLIKATGWSIFHSLWQGAIIYGLLLLSVMTLPRLQSRLKHNLAYAAICLLFISFVITFFSVFKLPETGNVKTVVLIKAEYEAYVKSLPEQISHRAEYAFPYLVSLYCAGLIFQLVMLSGGYRKMLSLKKAARLAVPEEWNASFMQLTSSLKIRKKIGFYLSEQINVPLVIGYFKPIVLFPVALAAQLDIAQVEAILIHELSHIRRNDYLLNLIKTAIETILFFNPFVWLSGRFINIEREHACDDLVLKFTGTPVTYAHALLKLEILKDQSSPALSMAITGKNQHLYQRIKRITDMKTNYMNAKQQLFAITLAIATVVSLAWVKPSEAKKTAQQVTDSNKLKAPLAPIPPLAPSEILALPPLPPLPPMPESLSSPIQALPVILLNDEVFQDTTKRKKATKYTIITVDENGKKKKYHSFQEMPEKVRNNIVDENFRININQNLNIDSIVSTSISFLKSPEWKKAMVDITNNAKDIQNYFISPEWKKQQEEIKKSAEQTESYFNSPEWKKHQKELEHNAAEMEKYFNSPEWKDQQQSIKKQAESAQKQALQLQKQAALSLKQTELSLKQAERSRKKAEAAEKTNKAETIYQE